MIHPTSWFRVLVLLGLIACLPACGGGSGQSEGGSVDVYRLDLEQTFDLYDLDDASPGTEREALARANAQAIALAENPDFRLELASDGAFTLHLSASERAQGTWVQTGSTIRMETTMLEGQAESGATDATVVEEGVLRIDAEGESVYLRLKP